MSSDTIRGVFKKCVDVTCLKNASLLELVKIDPRPCIIEMLNSDLLVTCVKRDKQERTSDTVDTFTNVSPLAFIHSKPINDKMVNRHFLVLKGFQKLSFAYFYKNISQRVGSISKFVQETAFEANFLPNT